LKEITAAAVNARLNCGSPICIPFNGGPSVRLEKCADNVSMMRICPKVPLFFGY